MSFISALLGSKLAVAAIAVSTVAAGGTAAAAYTGNLPTGLQEQAHSLIGAPSAAVTTDAPNAPATSDPATEPAETIDTPTAEPTDSPTGAPTPEPTASAEPADHEGPDATGPAGPGLCNAFAHGGIAPSSDAFTALARAAGDPANIPAFCATIGVPGKSDDHGHQPERAPTAPSPVAPAPAPAPPAHTPAPEGHGEQPHGSSGASGQSHAPEAHGHK